MADPQAPSQPPTVLATLPLPEPVPSMLRTHAQLRVLGMIPSHHRLTREVAHADVLCAQLRDTVDAAVLAAGSPRLKAVCNYAAGHDNIDMDAATRLGVAVTNPPDVLTNASADCTLGLIIAAARRFFEADRELRSGRYRGWRPDYLLGLELTGARLGLVGFGRIARAVARRARAFGMELVFHDDGCDALPEDLRECVRVGPDELFSSCDVVSLHVPLTAQTYHLVDEHRLKQMRPTAVLANTSRGPVVDEAALTDALRQGWIAGAGLDVYEHEPRLSPGLAGCPNAVLLPHVGSATTVTRSRMAELVARNVIAVLSRRAPPNQLNLPGPIHGVGSSRSTESTAPRTVQ